MNNSADNSCMSGFQNKSLCVFSLQNSKRNYNFAIKVVGPQLLPFSRSVQNGMISYLVGYLALPVKVPFVPNFVALDTSIENNSLPKHLEKPLKTNLKTNLRVIIHHFVRRTRMPISAFQSANRFRLRKIKHISYLV